MAPPIHDGLMGDVWPANLPGKDGAVYATVEMAQTGPFEVRSFQSFAFVITMGEFGMDDTGAIKIVSRWTSDSGACQCDDPEAINYVTATASNGAGLECYIEPYPHQRPWYNGIRITVSRGYLSPGDQITVVLGDRSGGSPGFRLQTFPEAAHEFRVLADVCATGVFLPVSAHEVEIVPGPAHRWSLVAPTCRAAGERFALGVKAEDVWGNATAHRAGEVFLRADGPVEGLPERVTLADDALATQIDGLSVAREAVTRFEISDAAGQLLARSNPVVTGPEGTASFWGDLHGQSGESVGINPIADYFAFARDVAFLDVTSHQANDFQVTSAFWDEINAQARAFNSDGRFVVFPGYEWSGNTPVGGDHNVFFREEGRAIRRSSHALLEDRSDVESDANDLPALFEALAEEDCVIYAHVGGRPADISFAEDARLRTAVEVHSDWGTFEWIMTDAFELGYRVGLVCNSDGHKGAPGACYPGASEFGAYSGLTCFLSDSLTRDGIFGAMRRRHHYGTTGCRMHLSVEAELGESGALFAQDPRLGEVEAVPARRVRMGDIARTDASAIDLHVRVNAHAPIERIDVLNGAETVATHRPYGADDLGSRVRVLWHGAEYRGRGRTTHWAGALRLAAAQIQRFETINIWNPERLFEQVGRDEIRFDCVTTGNFCGCDLWLDEGAGGALEIDTALVEARLALSEIGAAPVVLEAGGLARQITVQRLPERLSTLDETIRVPVTLNEAGDTPVWVRVCTEDGFVAWSSPIYLI